jgi:aryl-alcohol dehydrogenase-like predicted oxidoreductase
MALRHEGFSSARRRTLARVGTGVLAALCKPLPAATPAAMLTRKIPKSGEALPVVGLGTYSVFDVARGGPEFTELREVMRLFVAEGASVVDSSPMYGRAESIVGELLAEPGLRKPLFLATKVWTSGRQSGIQQMEQSLARMHAGKTIDLMQVHNLVDVETHTKTLSEWRDAGKLRYTGITHYDSSGYRGLERLLGTRQYDFVQFNYSLAEREAEARLLPYAAETGTAVIINRPFAEGSLFAKVRGKALPAWAADFDCESWAQFFLKYIIAHPAVTCVIPGTGSARHMADNLKAGYGRLPDAAMRKRMVDTLQKL